MKPLGVDFKNAVFNKDTGFLSIPSDTGYDINLQITPQIKLHEQLGNDGQLAFFASLNIVESTITARKGAITNQKDLDKYVKTMPFIPKDYEYEDFLLGFIYANADDPNNHQWFLQFRNKQGGIMESLPVTSQVDISCPTATYSWFEDNWHGRFKFKPNELKDVKEISTGHIEIKGKKCGGYPKGNTSIAPKGTGNISISYNIFTNKWTAYMQGLDELVKLECDSIILDVKAKGFVDRNHEKPKVTQIIEMKDVASIQFLSDTLIIYGV